MGSINSLPSLPATYSATLATTVSGLMHLTTNSRWNGVNLSSQSLGNSASYGNSWLYIKYHSSTLDAKSYKKPLKAGISFNLTSSAHILSKIQGASGFSGRFSSMLIPPVMKNLSSSLSSSLLYSMNLRERVNAKSSLSFSNRDLHILIYKDLVKYFSRF